MKVLQPPDAFPDWTEVVKCKCGARLECVTADVSYRFDFQPEPGKEAAEQFFVRCPFCRAKILVDPDDKAKEHVRPR